MGLVDGNHPHLHLAEMLDEAPLAQPLRRDIEELQTAAEGVVEHCRHRVGRHAGGETGGLHGLSLLPYGRDNPPVVELLHLVLHQRYLRRHHQTEPLTHQRRQLVAKRLATTSGKQGQRIVALHYGVYDVFLQGAKRVVAPVFFQQAVACVVHQRIRVIEPVKVLRVGVPGLR